MSAHDVPDLAYGDAPDSFDSHDGRTYSGPVTATPGQAAYEALHASLLARNPDHKHVPWGELDELTRHADGWYRADFEAAAIAAAPQPAPGDDELRSRLTALAAEHGRTAEAYQKSIPPTDPGSADGFRKQASADAWRSSAAGIRDALRLTAAQEPHAAPECDDSGDDCPAHGEPQPAPELAALREGIAALARDLDASARATSPSKKSNIEAEIAIALRKLLEGK